MNFILIEYTAVTIGMRVSQIQNVIRFDFMNNTSELPKWYSPDIFSSMHYQHMSTDSIDSYYTLLDYDELQYFRNKDGWIRDELLPIIIKQARNKRIFDIL